MKYFYVFILLTSNMLFSQEICNNGIDDDGDALIDLNDEDCDCEGLEGFSGLIPNPSFEDTLCCPDDHAMLDCADEWIQASWATSDLYNSCGFEYHPFGLPPEFPLPGGGEGFVGFYEQLWDFHEMVGTCVNGTMVADVEYSLSLFTAWCYGNDILELSLYGTPNCDDLPWAGTDCPVGFGDWELLTSTEVTYTMDGSWQEVTLSFTPDVDINAIAIGGPCGLVTETSYYYLDGLNLIDDDHFTEIVETGDWCDGDLTLSTEIDTFGGAWQWYKDGIALVGETGESVNCNEHGFGLYTAVYSIGGQCLRLSKYIEVDEAIFTNYTFESVCIGEGIEFENTSIFPDEADIDWQWDFDDGDESTDESPVHTFDAAGTYAVQLIGSGDGLCSDTAVYEVEVYPEPNAHIEFIAGGLSSEDGSTGGCILNPVQFNDLSTIESGSIIDWNWNFGDGESSDEENPEHLYDAVGTYTVTLTVTSEFGCSATTSIDITMDNGLAIDLEINEPTCFGLSDGSITINVGDIVGEAIFEIKNSVGELLNEDNSNTANTLTTGWYYFSVVDESDCAAMDSVFLDQPEELDVDLTLSNVDCFGNETGWARVDEVFNFTGDYADISYIWNPNPADIGGVFADSSYNMGAGDYTLTINDENGCAKTFDFEITEPDSMYFSEFGFEPAFCRLHEYQKGNGVVFGAASGGTPDFDYVWTNLDTEDTWTNSTWGGLNPGNYQLTATDENGCILTRTIKLDSLNPIADFTVTSDQLNADLKGTAPVEALFTNTSQNFANPNNPLADTTFFWNLDHPTTDWTITHDYFELFDTTYEAKGQTYEVEVCLVTLNSNGCSDTTCKIITIFEPTAFTEVNIFSPNGDGINDYFSFEHRAASISELTCVIVNRWGVVMHEMNSVDDAWDGTDKSGSPYKDGTYFYTYSIVTDDGTKIEGQGNITLIGGE